MPLKTYCNKDLECERNHNMQHRGQNNDNIKLRQYVDEIKDAHQTEILTLARLIGVQFLGRLAQPYKKPF